MLGTIVNTACIVAGTLIGALFKKGLGEKYTKTLFNAMGLALVMVFFAEEAMIAQTPEQKGVVKSRGRMVNGKLVPGERIPDAVIQLADRSVLSRKPDGCFSFPTRGQIFQVRSVKKEGYQLLDPQACREYTFSRDTLFLVMEPPQRQRADELAKERQFRRDLAKKLQEREEEIERMKLSLDEKNRLLTELNKQRDENETIIRDLARYYSTLDYDQLSNFQQQVANLLEIGEIEKADSLLRSRGNMSDRIREVELERAAEEKEEVELARRQENLTKSREGTRKKLEDIAADCNNYHQLFLLSHQNDSAAYYMELRACLDTTNLEWQNAAGAFLMDYRSDYDKAQMYFRRIVNQSADTDIWKAYAYNRIGSILLKSRDYQAALGLFLQALSINNLYGVDNPDVATSLNNIGNAYFSLHDYSRALDYHFRGLRVFERISGPESSNVATSYINIGFIYREMGDSPKALDYFLRALASREIIYGQEAPEVARCYNNIGNVYDDLGDYAKALEYQGQALAIFEKVLGPEHLDVAITHERMGFVYYHQGDYPKALECFIRVLPVYERVFGAESLNVAACCENLGGVYIRMGDFAKALEYHLRALSIRERQPMTEGVDLVVSFDHVGDDYYELKDYPNALKDYLLALPGRKKAFGADHENVATACYNIGSAYFNLEDYPNALDFFLQALAVYETCGGDRDSLLETYNMIVAVYLKLGDDSKAAEYTRACTKKVILVED